VSGNPTGRPKGLQDKRAAFRELLVLHAKDLIDKAVSLAKNGDTTALRLCLERILPPMRAKDETVDLGQMTGTLAGRGQIIMDASLVGKITPRQASMLMQALVAQVRVVEADELAARLEVLERQVNRSS
jgi:hypothetical protein